MSSDEFKEGQTFRRQLEDAVKKGTGCFLSPDQVELLLFGLTKSSDDIERERKLLIHWLMNEVIDDRIPLSTRQWLATAIQNCEHL